jgi:uncharacterized protein
LMTLSPGRFQTKTIVEGRGTISGGVIFSSTPIAFLQGVDPEKGAVSDKKHEIFDREFRKKILVFPNSVGSSVGAYVIYRMGKNGVAPIAIVNLKPDIITASGCALAGIPLYEVSLLAFEQIGKCRELSIDGETGEMRILS